MGLWEEKRAGHDNTCMGCRMCLKGTGCQAGLPASLNIYRWLPTGLVQGMVSRRCRHPSPEYCTSVPDMVACMLPALVKGKRCSCRAETI